VGHGEGILLVVQIKQYVYFALDSESVTAATITGRLGFEPDEIRVRGARDAERVIPRTHSWKVQSRLTNRPIDEMLAELLARLAPVEDQIAALVQETAVQARIQVVRKFNDPDGDEDEGTPPELAAKGWEKLGGQHHLLGWHLERQTLDFLQKTHAELDVDEYG
jgi:hypothetical protein